MRKLCILLILPLLLTSAKSYQSDNDYYASWKKLFDEWFTEPVESAYFFWFDGTVLKITSYEWNTVSCNPSEAKREIENRGYKVSGIVLIIHNHILPGGFSQGDRNFLRAMREYGFTGVFLLYYAGSVYILREVI